MKLIKLNQREVEYRNLSKLTTIKLPNSEYTILRLWYKLRKVDEMYYLASNIINILK